MSPKKQPNNVFNDVFETVGNGQGPDSRLCAPVMSFHPKLDLANSNLAEVCIGAEIAKSCGQQPVWVPYPYDLGLKTGADKIKSPISVQFENQPVKIMSTARVGSKPINAVQPFNQKELDEFAAGMRAAFTYSLNLYKEQIHDIKLGHPLFHMKDAKKIKQIENEFATAFSKYQIMLQTTLGTNSLSDQLAMLNGEMANAILGTNIVIRPMDQILAEDHALVDTILDSYAEIEAKAKPEKPDPLIKVLQPNGDRLPLYSRGNAFRTDNKTLSKEEVALLTQQKKVTINGDLFFAVLNQQGYGLTLGGKAVESYYDAMFENSEMISTIWGTPFHLKYLLHDVAIEPNTLNLRQTAASMRVMEKVASRNLLVNGNFQSDFHVADHLNFLGGIDAVPDEFKTLTTASTGPSALDKKTTQAETIAQDLEIVSKDIPDESNVVGLAKKHQCKTPKPAYLQCFLQTKLQETQSYASGIRKDIELEQVFLGGTNSGEYQDGVIKRTSRYPTALTLLLSGKPINVPELNVSTVDHLKYCAGAVTAKEPENVTGAKSYTSAEDLFGDFFGQKRLPFGMGKTIAQPD